mmetsp:Transcript_11174/g.24822  ORF Transcript_11174/g.24822 Transcript_11174/m.24822 type:complete len:253 (+) Transcript_11174:1493-2251(+)
MSLPLVQQLQEALPGPLLRALPAFCASLVQLLGQEAYGIVRLFPQNAHHATSDVRQQGRCQKFLELFCFLRKGLLLILVQLPDRVNGGGSIGLGLCGEGLASLSCLRLCARIWHLRLDTHVPTHRIRINTGQSLPILPSRCTQLAQPADAVPPPCQHCCDGLLRRVVHCLLPHSADPADRAAPPTLGVEDLPHPRTRQQHVLWRTIRTSRIGVPRRTLDSLHAGCVVSHGGFQCLDDHLGLLRFHVGSKFRC